jgi:hypothetical protein
MVRRNQLIFFSGCSVCNVSWATTCNVTKVNIINSAFLIGLELS